MQHSDQMRDILVRLDVAGIKRLWMHVAPHLPQPSSDYEALAMMHNARTQAESIDLRLRAYSHQWLLANGLPSPLPNDLLPAAERIDFKFSFGVGISVKSSSNDPQKQALASELEASMAGAAAEAVASGRLDTDFLRSRMNEARDRTMQSFGRPKITVRAGYSTIGFKPANVR